jgi:pyruvate-ferredoxin/flavodoxin oxidoreductase
MTAFELAGLHVKANPKYGSEKKGQPTTFYAVLAHEPIRFNAELKNVDVVLSPDANVFRHSNPLAGLSEGGAFVIQSDLEPRRSGLLPPRRSARSASGRSASTRWTASGSPATRRPTRSCATGCRARPSWAPSSTSRPLAEREGLDEEKLFAGIRDADAEEVRQAGRAVVEDNLRVIRRGYDEMREVPSGEVGEDAAPAAGRQIPALLDVAGGRGGARQPGPLLGAGLRRERRRAGHHRRPVRRHQRHARGHRAVRDMTGIRFEVPGLHRREVHRLRQCWTQCPDAAIPGWSTRSRTSSTPPSGPPPSAERGPGARRSRSTWPARRARSWRRALPCVRRGALHGVPPGGRQARLGAGAARRAGREFAAVYEILAEFPLAKTAPFFDLPERKEKGTGGCSRSPSTRSVQGLQHLRGRLPDGALVTVQAGRGDRRPAAPQLGLLAASCRTPTTASSTSATWTRGSASSPRCCSRRRPTAPWSAATAPAWAAARRPRCTW